MADFAILSPQITRGLSDKLYDKRKSAALEVERIVREYVINNETTRIRLIIDMLVQDFVYSVSPNARNGGLIGLAATSISLGPNVSTYLDIIVQPVVTCFSDPDSRVRYYACESMYNIAKVARGSILRYFNELFDSLSKLYADTETSVRNGAELLDRLIKDIVHEQSIAYSGPITHIGDKDPQQLALQMPRESQFSLPRFIPLLRERVYAQNPWTRNYLVTWIAVLDSIPDLELVSFLPDFLDGLLYFLSDSNPDVRTLTQTLLNNFLSEIREIAELQQHQQELQRIKQLRLAESHKTGTREGNDVPLKDPLEEESTGQGKGNWVPGQGVVIEYAEIVKILKPHLTSSDEDIQETALRWINEFIELAKDVMIEFIPVLIPAILPCLAHSVTSIRTIANETNLSLYKLVYESPLPVPPAPPVTVAPPASANHERAASPRPQSPRGQERLTTSTSIASKLASSSNREQAATRDTSEAPTQSPSITAVEGTGDKQEKKTSKEPFDYTRTVHALTLQFLNEHEQTRVASLEWLLMLHKRAPHLILVEDDGSFPILLKTLSDPSEEVIKRDLQLLAQISSYSDDGYFTNFMFNLLNLFGTDRRLLETRGSVIIRQLCVSLNSEKIYRTLAELIEKEDELDFANTMVQNLNIILITAPELADLRRKLRNADSREGQALFTVLYKSWCHNPVSTFALCLMAQYYEHAVALLQSFVEFEITVNLLIQVDKLVQLIESPVFTYLRLQLLEPDRYPHLFKCLYGLLMLLPQSTAFATLRNRLTSVSSMGFIHLVPKLPQGNQSSVMPYSSGRIKGSGGSTFQNDNSSNFGSGSNGGGNGPKFQELLAHFRAVQSRHERARRGTIQNMMRENAYGTNAHLKAANMNNTAGSHGGGGYHTQANPPHLHQTHHPQQRQISYDQPQHDATYGNNTSGYHDTTTSTGTGAAGHRASATYPSSSPNGAGASANVSAAAGGTRRRTRDSRLEPPSSMYTGGTGGSGGAGGGTTPSGSPNAGPTVSASVPSGAQASRSSYQGPKSVGGGQSGNSALSPSSAVSPPLDQDLSKK
ncbi:hypothetical protein BGW41_004018 [Actinomortierella wolfii]|nr:hypothetical protein BGW41_004018 [Actinomortierella wolfii]